jgi:chromatin assembly factor 1 subunit A
VNYDVDSDEEWEEEEPGESISDSEGEENENGQEEDDEDDGFFVPHGYLSEDEGGDDECRRKDVCGDAEQRSEMAHAKAVETELARKCQPLRPFAVGCVWISSEGTPSTENVTVMGHTLEFLLENLKLCEAVAIVPTPIEVVKSSNTVARVETALTVPSAVKTVSSPLNQPVGAPKMTVPDEALPDLIRFIHGNIYGVKKLLDIFRDYWAVKIGLKGAQASVDNSYFSIRHDSGISKRQLELKIQSMAVKELRTGYPRSCWYVHTHVISKYGLQESDLPVPNHTFVAQVESVAATFRPQVKTLSVHRFNFMNSGKPGQGHVVLPVSSVSEPVINLTAD